MNAVAFRSRAVFRRRWAAWLGLAIVLGIVGGTCLSFGQAARATNVTFASFARGRLRFFAGMTEFRSTVTIYRARHRDVRTLQLIARVSNGIVAVLCLATATVLIVGWRRPPLALTPRGVQSFLGTVTWERIDAMPSLPRRYPSAHSRGARFAEMDADPQFVAAAIEYYRRHPDARAMIGHADEYDRLSQAIAANSGI